MEPVESRRVGRSNRLRTGIIDAEDVEGIWRFSVSRGSVNATHCQDLYLLGVSRRPGSVLIRANDRRSGPT